MVITGISPVLIYRNSWVNVLLCSYIIVTSVPDPVDTTRGGICECGQSAGKYSEYPKISKSPKHQENT
nr:MAG TPA: hypothetical protein [Caudoviricetes sp.]